MKLRLARGEFEQVPGPVTGKRYVFVRQAGHNDPVEIDPLDWEQMKNRLGGCCGVQYRMFEQVDD